VAEELRHPERVLPWSILWGLGIVTVLYLAVNWIYMLYIPLSQMPSRPLVASEVMQAAWGPVGAKVTAVMVVCSAFGALNGFILTSGRILLAVGREHFLFSRLSRIDPRFATPARALVFNALIATALVWLGTFDQIVTYSTVVISVFFAMTALSVIILRVRDPVARRPYRVWGYPVTPVLFAAAMAFFIADLIVKQPRETLFGFGLMAIGIPLYLWSRRQRGADLSASVSGEVGVDR